MENGPQSLQGHKYIAPSPVLTDTFANESSIQLPILFYSFTPALLVTGCSGAGKTGMELRLVRLRLLRLPEKLLGFCGRCRRVRVRVDWLYLMANCSCFTRFPSKESSWKLPYCFTLKPERKYGKRLWIHGNIYQCVWSGATDCAYDRWRVNFCQSALRGFWPVFLWKQASCFGIENAQRTLGQNGLGAMRRAVQGQPPAAMVTTVRR